jgi:predicted metalloprotease with PDZ domain
MALLLSIIPAAAQKKAAKNAAPAPTITIAVDATEAPRKIFHAHLVIPATPGTMDIFYPKWIPGEHMPSGPLVDLTGLKFMANGKELTWRRDLQEMFEVHVQVPPGTSSIEASLDYVSPVASEGFSAGSSATAEMAVISWNQLLLYPAGWTYDQLTYRASLRLPEGWKFGTPLPVASQSGAEISFQPVSLYTLVDSPVITGANFLAVPLATAAPTAELDVAADSPGDLNVPPEVWEHYKNLVTQAGALFGARHYRDYHFLLSLSDHVAHFGLEHHEANDSRIGERGLADARPRVLSAGLLPHEYVHSWNGKYRRPADLTTSNYDQPMQTDLLWVYEGLTSYLGEILTARSGLWTPQQFMDSIASIAAELDHRPGRTWRNLQDTADGAQFLYSSSRHWESWRRGTDFYDEDVLNWLWVDVIIRQQTQGRRSIDDFCKAFHGAPSGPPMVKTYTFDDIVNTLNQIAPYDWRTFWLERLNTHAPHAPLGGIEGSGWKVVYDDKPSEFLKDHEEERKETNAEYSLGLDLREKGEIVDVIHDSPAARAGIGPGMTLVAVNGKKFKREVLRDALRESTNSKQPIELLVENTDYYKTYSIDYHGGAQYPHLVRDTSKPDLLNEIIKPVPVAGQ